MSRISYRNYPTLEYLNDNSKQLKTFVYEEDYKLILNNDFEKQQQILKDVLSIKTKVTNISKKFIDTVKFSFDKINEIINKDINDFEDIFINESFIIDGFLIHTIQQFSKTTYNIKTVVLEKEGYIIATYEKKGWKENPFIWETKSHPYIFEINNTRYNIAVYFSIITLHAFYFKKYASVEIVESKAKSKIFFAGCKYLNETDLDIEYLDSKWFTTLVNSQGFKVRGFFRLQPKKKNGEWTKELIWIDEFEKQGYNRQAKILNN